MGLEMILRCVEEEAEGGGTSAWNLGLGSWGPGHWGAHGGQCQAQVKAQKWIRGTRVSHQPQGAGMSCGRCEPTVEPPKLLVTWSGRERW